MTEHSHTTVKDLTLIRVRTTAKWIGWVALGATAILCIVALTFWVLEQPPNISLVATVVTPVRYWILALGVGLALEWRYYIAVGVTRRTHHVSTLLTLLAAAAMMTLWLATLFLVEAILWHQLEWMAATDAPQLFGPGWQSHLVILQYMILLSTHAVGGWLIAVTFQRMRAWAVLVLPVVITGLIAIGGATGGDWTSMAMKEHWAYEPSVLKAVVCGVAGLVLMYAAGRRLMRQIPMAPKSN